VTFYLLVLRHPSLLFIILHYNSRLAIIIIITPQSHVLDRSEEPAESRCTRKLLPKISRLGPRNRNHLKSVLPLLCWPRSSLSPAFPHKLKPDTCRNATWANPRSQHRWPSCHLLFNLGEIEVCLWFLAVLPDRTSLCWRLPKLHGYQHFEPLSSFLSHP